MSHAGALAALDPGRSKCGLVRSDPQGQWIEEALILNPRDCLTTLQHWQQLGQISAVVLGDGTGSRHWREQISALQLPLHVIDEWGTTLDARRRYWELWPARGWKRLLPQGLRLPPRDLDDVAAQILLERWLQQPLTRRVRSGPEP